MRIVSIIAVVGALVAITLISYSSRSEHNLESQFYTFMTDYGKSYSSQEELEFRMQVFKLNMQEAQRIQALNPDALFGVNQFADMTDEEFRRLLGDFPHDDDSIPNEIATEITAGPSNIDWRPMMNPVQNQRTCGCCWSFAATATFETHLNIRGLGLTKLSEQEMIDCVKTCNGCNGGLAHKVYTWLSENDASTNAYCLWDTYRYNNTEGVCQSRTCDRAQYNRDTGYGMVASDEAAILKQLEKGPISVSVDATLWKNYINGTLTDCTQNTNHAVVLSGYNNGEKGAKPYWIIRNSWGPNWGEKGSINLLYGNNTCNITRRPSYPTF